MNKVILTGRITQDLEVRMTQSGSKVLSFSIAVKRETKDQNGEYPVDFIDVTCWEQKAEFLDRYASKGTLIGVCGRMETNTYQNQQGQKVKSTRVKADQVEILSIPKKETSQDSYPADTDYKQEIRIEKTNVGADVSNYADLEFY